MKQLKIFRLLPAMLLAVCLSLSFAACGGQADSLPAAKATPAPAEESAAITTEPGSAVENAGAATYTSPQPAASVDTELPVRVMTLNGTTGFGMAGLMAEAAAGNADTALNYRFTVETDPSNVTAALVNGDCDIAALPTNAAAALYNKTGGAVQVLALNTRGVLYLVTDGSVEIHELADLAGQTVFAPAQNPSFIFAALCKANDVEVNIDNRYAQPAELNTAVAAGEVSLAVLPEPMVTVARSQNEKLTVALDLTEEWDKAAVPGSLVQGCAVVRRDFAADHPAELTAFLKDYETSIALLSEDPATAAQAIEDTGIFAKAAVAQKAIPNCNICFVTGEEMREQFGAFLEIMAEAAPQSIGGAVPGQDFYCILP